MEAIERETLTQLELAITRGLDVIRGHLDDEPDWEPLRKVVPREWRAGFMWMGRTSGSGGPVEHYKHGITRRYLHLDHRGVPHASDTAGVLRPARLDEALLNAFEGLEILGGRKSTVYDIDFAAGRNARLRALGYRILS